MAHNALFMMVFVGYQNFSCEFIDISIHCVFVCVHVCDSMDDDYNCGQVLLLWPSFPHTVQQRCLLRRGVLGWVLPGEVSEALLGVASGDGIVLGCGGDTGWGGGKAMSRTSSRQNGRM